MVVISRVPAYSPPTSPDAVQQEKSWTGKKMLSPVHSICDFYCKPVSEGGCQVNNFGYMERQSEKNSHSQSGFSAVVPGIWLCPYNI